MELGTVFVPVLSAESEYPMLMVMGERAAFAETIAPVIAEVTPFHFPPLYPS